MITCYVRYVLDPEQLDAFAEYGRLWIGLIDGEERRQVKAIADETRCFLSYERNFMTPV